MDPASGQLVQGGVQAQTRQVTPSQHHPRAQHNGKPCLPKVAHCIFKKISPPQALVNMGEILKAAGCGYENGEKSFSTSSLVTQLSTV